MKTRLEAKEKLESPTTIWFISVFRCRKRWKYQMQKLQWIRNGRRLRQFFPGSWERSKVRRIIFWKHRDEKKVHFASLMDICHLKNAALEPQFQKCQGRVVLRGDVARTILYLVQYLLNNVHQIRKWLLHEVMDDVARLPDWRMSSRPDNCWHSGENGGRSTIAQNSEVRLSRHVDTIME